ncbi:MAG: nucleotide exchange factor GrpE [Candidatus Saccharimonadales bacterium]
MTKPKTPKQVKEDEKLVELTADLQRVQADFINYRRRAEEDKVRAAQNGKEQAVLALLPVLDNIERAIAHEPADIKDHQWVKGVSAIATQLEAQLESIGLTKIGVVGEPFDPSRHEAVSMGEGDGDTEVIAAVLQTGYQFDDTIIRPAMVQVTRGTV